MKTLVVILSILMCANAFGKSSSASSNPLLSPEDKISASVQNEIEQKNAAKAQAAAEKAETAEKFFCVERTINRATEINGKRGLLREAHADKIRAEVRLREFGSSENKAKHAQKGGMTVEQAEQALEGAVARADNEFNFYRACDKVLRKLEYSIISTSRWQELADSKQCGTQSTATVIQACNQLMEE